MAFSIRSKEEINIRIKKTPDNFIQSNKSSRLYNHNLFVVDAENLFCERRV
jgi:hypothetical protein